MNLELLSRAKSGDDVARNQFIEINKPFIYKYTCAVCKRLLSWQNDDELSIALMAFNSSIDSFLDGDFEAYSKMVIKSRLIDFFRKNKRNEIPIEEYCITGLLQYSCNIDEKLDRAAQIEIFKETLKKFNINMLDLVKNSPKHKDTRQNLLKLALNISRQDDIIKILFKKRLLPIKEIINSSNVSRKFVEEWRRYIIALVIIFNDKRLESLRDFIL